MGVGVHSQGSIVVDAKGGVSGLRRESTFENLIDELHQQWPSTQGCGKPCHPSMAEHPKGVHSRIGYCAGHSLRPQGSGLIP